jgi:hypothetical protein
MKHTLLLAVAVAAHATLPADADVLMAGLANPFGLDADTGLPESIQWMPPGTHTITAKALNGELKTVTVTANAAGAAAIQASFAAMRAEALAGKGDEPFFDFNHDDGVASAHPSEFYWAGDHPKDGGIRAKVTWTAAGAAAVKGKDYRRFSPIFLPGAGGTVLPAQGHANMGGLVNRAAFQRIAPVAAKQAVNNPAEVTPTEAQTKATNIMKTLLLAVMASHSITFPADAGDDVVAAKASELITQLGTERNALKTELTTVKASLDTAVTAHATSVVEAAVAAGKIAPQDEPTKAFWLGSLKSNAVAAKAALDALPVNPALAGNIVQAKAGNVIVTGAPGGEDAFVVAAKAHGTANKLGMDDALVDYAEKNPQAYEAYRDRMELGKKGDRK